MAANDPHMGDRVLRSLLFVPGSDREKLAKVAGYGSDAIVIDLEDAVAEDRKAEARELAADAVAGADARAWVVVRVNGAGTGRLLDDLEAVARPGLDCVLVPKVEDPDVLAVVDATLAQVERAQGIRRGAIALLALVETARGIARCERLLAGAPSRLLTAVFGSADFGSDIAVDATPQATELLHARSRLVAAARAAALSRPLDGPFLDLNDLDGLAADTRRSRGLGFQGRVVLHPRQVEPVKRAYSWLPEDQVEQARRVVRAFEEAESGGVASIRLDGAFVDLPIYHRAREKLRLYDAFERES